MHPCPDYLRADVTRYRIHLGDHGYHRCRADGRWCRPRFPVAAGRGRGDERGAVAVHGLNYIVKKICHDDRVLIVDDVFDTGLTIEAVIAYLQQKARLNTPHDIRVAVPYYKPSRNQTEREPDYYLYETAQWLKYPHSLEGLSAEEVAANRPELYAIIKDQLG